MGAVRTKLLWASLRSRGLNYIRCSIPAESYFLPDQKKETFVPAFPRNTGMRASHQGQDSARVCVCVYTDAGKMDGRAD